MSLCECGCKKQTRAAEKTSLRYGQVRGQSLRFIHGHNQRGSRNARYKGVDRWVLMNQGRHFCQCPPCVSKGSSAETAIRVLPRHFTRGGRGIPSRLPRHFKGLVRKEGAGQNISQALKRFYQYETPTHKQQRVETSRRNMGNWHQHFHRRPTGPEVALLALLPSSIRYVGDGSFYCWIPSLGRNRNPDFKVSGQPKVIELFGDFWHRFDEPSEIIQQYAEAGLRCLVVWEREVNDDPLDVVERCVRFATDMAIA